jgi:hypothetical protein
MLAILAVTTLTAGAGVVAMGGAPTGAAATKGYTVIWLNNEEQCQLATIDLVTAAVAPIGAKSLTSCVRDLAISPDGAVYGVRELGVVGLEAALVTFDTTTGAASSDVLTGNFSNSTLVIGGIAFAADGSMLVNLVTNETGCDGNVCLYRADPATRVATLIGPSGQHDEPFFYLTAACNGTTLSTEFQVRGDSTEADPPVVDTINGFFLQQLASWNTSTGAATRGVVLPDTFDLAGIEFDRASGTLYALGVQGASPIGSGEAPVEPQIINNASLFTIDVATGTVTAVAALPDPALFVDSLAIPGTCAAPAVEIVPTFTG